MLMQTASTVLGQFNKLCGMIKICYWCLLGQTDATIFETV